MASNPPQVEEKRERLMAIATRFLVPFPEVELKYREIEAEERPKMELMNSLYRFATKGRMDARVHKALYGSTHIAEEWTTVKRRKI